MKECDCLRDSESATFRGGGSSYAHRLLSVTRGRRYRRLHHLALVIYPLGDGVANRQV